MKRAYINGILLNGLENMQPQAGLVILTNGEKIEKIAPIEKVDLVGYEVMNLQGQYILPGLINMHVHLPGSGKPQKKQADNVKLVKLMTSNALMRKILQTLCEKYAKMELLSGVTTIRTMGGVESVDSIIRNRIAKKEIQGPRILASNMAISVPGGHMAGSLAYEAHNSEEAKMYVQKIAQDKPDVIKLMITGGVLDAKKRGEPGVLKMAPELVKAACDCAHSLGLKVAAHVESPQGVRVAVENGVDTIEHGASVDEEIISLFQKHHASHIATLSPALPYALFDRSISHVSEDDQYNGEVVFKGIIECAKACLRNNIPVGIGTDTGCPYITHYDMWREVNYFHKYCEVSTSFALHTATLGNARIAGIDGITGSIEEGKCADMIVTKENPLENLCTLRELSMVIVRGEIIKQPKVKKMTRVEVELDKFL